MPGSRMAEPEAFAEIANYRLESYAVFLARSMSLEQVLGVHFSTYILCMGPAGQRLALYFVRPDSPRPPNSYDPATGLAASFLPDEQYPRFIDLLRHENPVYAYVNRDTPEWNRIYTGPEPVGEGELAAQPTKSPKSA